MKKIFTKKNVARTAKVLLWTVVISIIMLFFLFLYVGINANHLNE